MRTVQPLPNGTVLADRFEVADLVGTGGFSLVYLGTDCRRSDEVIIKELAPPDARRPGTFVIELGPDGPALKRKFLDEGAMQAKMSVQGLVPVRATFLENGTAYIVSEHQKGSETLDSRLRKDGVLAPKQALDIFFELLDIVEELHRRHVLHRDIKPSNILIGPKGAVHLIDFGAAREWAHDSPQNETFTVLFTPGYAAPEQMSERARRGPATDVYALCATLHSMLCGEPPPSAMDRSAGTELTLLPEIEKRAGSFVREAIEAGLSLNMAHRPQSVEALRGMLVHESDASPTQSILELDDALLRARSFTHRKRECPACGGVLETARPLQRLQCPVCGRGRIKMRAIVEGLCPVCKDGLLKRHENPPRPLTCTCCGLGLLHYGKAKILSGAASVGCPQCGASGFFKYGRLSLQPLEPTRPIPRSPVVVLCNNCDAQFDEQTDGRWQGISPPAPGFPSMYPDEWYRIASGLDPGAGNAACDGCHAEYYLDDETLTLLGTHFDPHGFALEFEGRRLRIEDVRWLGTGKTSGHPGLVCDTCRTEFDEESRLLRLVYSPNARLGHYAQEVHGLDDWHRLAAGLPVKGAEHVLADRMEEALIRGYVEGEIGFEGKPELAWKGQAWVNHAEEPSPLKIDGTTIAIGALLFKKRRPLEELSGVTVDEDGVALRFRDRRMDVHLKVQPVELIASLKTGPVTVILNAEALGDRLRASIRSHDAAVAR